jgi:D-alanyl-D-alanine carboxypeptidase
MSEEITPEKKADEVVDAPAEKVPEVNALPVVPQLILLSALMLLIFGGTVTPRILALFDDKAASDALMPAQTVKATETKTEEQTAAFADITITAKSAYVFDIQNQKALYKKNESEQLPLASITKLMTALVAEEILGEKENITIGGISLRQDGGSGFREGERVERETLSDMVLMSSSNDGAYALASSAGKALGVGGDAASTFVDAMNIRAKEIGLHNTYFKNPSGLDLSGGEAGAYGSARDVAFLMEYIVKNEADILSFTKDNSARFYSETGEYHDAENTNDFVNKIPGLIGSKTGYTDLAGGNLVIAWNAGLGRPMVAVVLGSTQEERFSDIMKLVQESQKEVTKQQ